MSDMGRDEFAELPLDLQLDLLVDEELPEERRRALLLSLDKEPGRWRELSIRFLQRQIEKKSVRQLIAAGSIRPVVDETPVILRGPGRWFTGLQGMATAAGFAIMIAAGFGIVYLSNQKSVSTEPAMATAGRGGGEVITTDLPGSLWGGDGSRKVKLPVSETDSPKAVEALFQPNREGPRRSFVIKPDGTNNALIIPVTNMQFQ